MLYDVYNSTIHSLESPKLFNGMSDHYEIYTQFFLDPEVILRSRIMFINTSTKEFTLVNNAFPSHDVAYEHLLYYKMVANVY